MQRSCIGVWISLALLFVFVVSLVLGEHKTLEGARASALHEWVGMAGLACLMLHLIRYGKVIALSLRRFFEMSLAQQGFTVLNVAVLGLVLLTLLSGVLISSQLGFGNGASHWRLVHHVAPKLALVLVLAHAGLRWKKVKMIFGK